MNKEKFLETLRKKLSVLEESEIEDIITEYDGYIEEKIAEGETEEEAVKSMGNVSVLAKELLSAYKVKGEDIKSDSINNLVDRFINIFDRIVSVFAHKNFNEIMRFVFELIFIFIIIALCKIPFEIIKSMGFNMFNSLEFGVSHVFVNIWDFILELIYLVFAILIFIKIFEARYLDMEYVSVLRKDDKEKNKEGKIIKERKEKDRNTTMKTSSDNMGFLEFLSTIGLWFIKFILAFILFGVCCYLIGMSITVGLCVYFLIIGITYFGIYLIMLSLLILGIVLFLFLFNFIFNRKSHIGVLLIISLISIITLGIGTGICALEFASTTILYTDMQENIHEDEYIFDVVDNLIISNYFNEDDIIIDDNLKNQIKVVFKYNDSYIKLNSKAYISKNNDFNVLHASYRNIEYIYTKEHFNEFINNLKEKKLLIPSGSDCTIEIIMSNSTYEKIKENEKKYTKEKEVSDICEYLEEQDIYVPHHCDGVNKKHFTY